MSRSFAAGWEPAQGVRAGWSGFVALCALGIDEANFCSGLGSRKPQQWDPGRGVCIHSVVFGVKTADPAAWECFSSWWWFFYQDNVLFSFLRCRELIEGIFTRFCIFKKTKISIIASTHPVGFLPHPHFPLIVLQLAWSSWPVQASRNEKATPKPPTAFLLLKREQLIKDWRNPRGMVCTSVKGSKDLGSKVSCGQSGSFLLISLLVFIQRI